jgi:hypothetical protein
LDINDLRLIGRGPTRGPKHTPRGLLGSGGSLTRHSKSAESYLLMPTMNHNLGRRETTSCYSPREQVRGTGIMRDWREVHVGTEGDNVQIGGIKVWQHDWRPSGEDAVQLPHPSYPQQRHRFSIYETGPNSSPVCFAAGELSNGVWGFYIPA